MQFHRAVLCARPRQPRRRFGAVGGPVSRSPDLVPRATRGL